MRIHFRSDAIVDCFSNEEIVLKFPHTIASWKNPSEILQKRVKKLLEKEDLFDEYDADLPGLYYFLETLKSNSLLSYSIIENEKTLVTLIPHHNGNFEFRGNQIDYDLPMQISRFACLRRVKDEFIIESSLLQAIILIKNPQILTFFYALSSPKSFKALVKKFDGFSKEIILSIFSLFHRAHLLSDSDQNDSLACWEFHDLLFHVKSRHRGEQKTGATFRFQNQMPQPAVKESQSEGISLYKPDLHILKKSDPAFVEVLEKRKSIREHNSIPISKDQLGEFFFRIARIKETKKGTKYETTSRPYPGGGACYELELYPLIHSCHGLERGLYRYQPDTHSFIPLTIPAEEFETLLKDASLATGKTTYPQVLILIAARFQRVSWKYESMAYSLILKNTGVLLQTMYLTATAMNLAPCALGAGNSDDFARIAKTNYYEETTVGEFILGTCDNS